MIKHQLKSLLEIMVKPKTGYIPIQIFVFYQDYILFVRLLNQPLLIMRSLYLQKIVVVMDHTEMEAEFVWKHWDKYKETVLGIFHST